MPTGNWPQHVMPWEPGALGNDVFRLGRFYGSFGNSQGEIDLLLRRSPGSFRGQEIGRAAPAGAQWGDFIRDFQANDPGTPIPRKVMIRNNLLSSAYRFTVTFTFRDEDGNVTGYNTILIESSRNLTLSKMRQLAEETYGQIATYYERFNRMPMSGFEEMQINLAERRSG